MKHLIVITILLLSFAASNTEAQRRHNKNKDIVSTIEDIFETATKIINETQKSFNGLSLQNATTFDSVEYYIQSNQLFVDKKSKVLGKGQTYDYDILIPPGFESVQVLVWANVWLYKDVKDENGDVVGQELIFVESKAKSFTFIRGGRNPYQGAKLVERNSMNFRIENF